MRVVLLSPGYPEEMQRFTRGLSEVGATIIGAGDQPLESLPADTRRRLSGYVRLPGFADEQAATRTLVAALHGQGVNRIEALWEPVVLLAARMRATLGVQGMSYDTVMGFRDKQLMKERAAAGGCRVPRSHRATTRQQAMEAAQELGFPLVVKPIAGAGTATTWRVDSSEQLTQRLDQLLEVPEISVEEFITGEELTWDALCVDGRPVLDSVTQYFPPPLISRNEEWVSPAQLTYQDPAQPALQPGIALGHQVIAALGMQTGIVHMEWFRTPSGEAVLGEIACRPGGGRLMDMIDWANDIDIYRAWAQACWTGTIDQVAQRRYHVAAIFKRALGQGRIVQITGAQDIRRELGPHLVADELLPIGAPRRDWKQTLLGDGWMAVRHPDLDTCKAMMRRIVGEVRLFAG